MRDDGHRFDTAPVPVGKHLLPETKRPFPGRFRERRVPRWVYRVILILALSALAVLGWYNRVNLAPENALQWVQSHVVGLGAGDGFPQKIPGSSVAPKNFIASEKNLFFASDTALVVYNSSARELLDRQHSYSSPVLKVSGPRFLLYHLGGKSCETGAVGDGDPLQRNTDQNILGGALAANGRFALLSAAEGYCGKMTAYTASGQVLSYYWFSDYYPTAVALNADGTRAAVTGVSAKNGGLVSAVYLIDLSGGKTVRPAAVVTGGMMSAVFWDAESTVAAVGDTGVLFLNPSSGAKTDFSYDGSKLTAYCSDGGRVALGLAPYEGSPNQKLVVLGPSGNRIYSGQVGGAIQSVALFGQTAAALSDGKVYFQSLASASSVSIQNAGSDAGAIALKDEKSAYILGISEIRLVKSR